MNAQAHNMLVGSLLAAAAIATLVGCLLALRAERRRQP